jgi:membrane fusion protein, heavy metal efflux system
MLKQVQMKFDSFRQARRATAMVLLTAAASFLLSSCGGAPQMAKVKAADNPPTPDLLAVKMTPDLSSRVTVKPAEMQEVARTFRASGRVQADEFHLARISSPLTGKIADIHALEGEYVKRGQELATLNSTELSNIELTFLEACSRRQLAEKAVERAQQLLKADVIGSAELQKREADLQEKIEEVSAARAQLKVLGISDRAIAALEKGRSVDSVSHIVASVPGTILERRATVGQTVPPAETVFVIADLSLVWLIADIPEESAGHLRVGKAVRAEVLAFPGEIIEGKLAYVSPTVNPETRTVRIRMNLPNSKLKYKPDMLANVSLEDVPVKRLAVPSSAVIREDNKDYVFARAGKNDFRLREVSLAEDLENRRVVTSGLQPGEEIVVSGAFHLNNERKRLALVTTAE